MKKIDRHNILIVEDNPKTADNLALYLENEGHHVTLEGDGCRGLELARSGHFSLVVLDLMLPGMNGLELCRALRRESRIPVLMLTARTLEDERVRGLEMGADDYVTKPFSPREVAARVNALLRRDAWGVGHVDQTESLEGGGAAVLSYRDIELDRLRHGVRRGGLSLELTATEFKLLEVLMRHPGRVFGRAALIDEALGHGFEGMDRTVDAHIMKLRRKIEPDRRRPIYVKTVFGVGYKLGDEDV